MDVRKSYDDAARGYAEHLFGELEHKPLDRHLLNRFAEDIRGAGLVADLGCGPGHVARYLSDRGVSTIGIDLSPTMVRCASEYNPGLTFRVGDMAKLDDPDEAFAGLVSFYSIVHLAADELEPVFREMRRVSRHGAPMLLSFHMGDDIVHAAELFGARVSLDFIFHRPKVVIHALAAAGFSLLEQSERAPYAAVEYPSRRCYLLSRAC